MIHIVDGRLLQRARTVGTSVVDQITHGIFGGHLLCHRGRRRYISQINFVEQDAFMFDPRRTALQRDYRKPLIKQVLRNRLADPRTCTRHNRYAVHIVFSEKMISAC